MENARTKRQQILLGVQCCLITILVILSLLKEFIDIPFVHFEFPQNVKTT